MENKNKKTMKKYFAIVAVALMTAASFSSCCSVNYPQYSSATPAIGSKVGEASSKTILGFIGKGGPKATLKDAADNGGITKIYHVERTEKIYFLGIVQKHTTRVYGD